MSSLVIPTSTLPTVVNFVRGAVAVAATAAVAPEAVAIGGSLLLIGGAYLAAGAAYHYFSQSNLQNIKDKALAKHVKGKFESGLYDVRIRHQGILGGFEEGVVPRYGGYFDSGITQEQYVRHFNSEYTAPPDLKNLLVQKIISNGAVLRHPNDANWFAGILEPVTILSQEAATTWDKLTDDERRTAINNLTDDDWKSTIESMPEGGVIQPGQTLSNDVMAVGTGMIYKSGNKALSPEAAEIHGALKPEIDSLREEIKSLPFNLNSAEPGTIGAGIAGLTGLARNTDSNVAKLGETVAEAQKTNNNNFNELKKRVKNIAIGINWDRLLLLMTWWQTLHNCMMLSADVSRSLVSSVETALAALPSDSLLGIPTEDADGSPLDIGKFISTSFESFIKGAIGAENYAELKLDLAKINRIYQASSNLLSQVQSLTNDLQNITELTGENTSRIGNALVRFGVVGENAYRAMDENMDTKTSFIHRLQNKLETAQSLAANLESIAQSVYSTEQTLVEIGNQSKEFKSAIKAVIPKSEADNTTVKKQQTIDKEASQSPTLSIDDLDKPHADNS